jgi:predicted TIM-barrel fold metal-dependent hydrolase
MADVSTKPYFIRAIYEWCSDCGFTPYLSVRVDDRTRVPMEYVKKGNLYFSAEVEDALLPQVLELVGDGQIVFGSDMPHGDRERFAAGMLRERHDISDAAKTKILESNPVKFYNLSRF